MKKNRIFLSQEEREQLERLSKVGRISVRKLKRIRILLLSDEGKYGSAKKDEDILAMVETSRATISRVRKRYLEKGLKESLEEKPRSGAPRKFSGKDRAVVTALACSEPPQGHAKWSLRMLANKLVELELVESISHDSVQEILKKTI